MMVMFILSSLLLATLVESALARDDYQGGLSRAYASPLNVDPKLDCAIKELAWEYAEKLLPRVSERITATSGVYYNFATCLFVVF